MHLIHAGMIKINDTRRKTMDQGFTVLPKISNYFRPKSYISLLGNFEVNKDECVPFNNKQTLSDKNVKLSDLFASSKLKNCVTLHIRLWKSRSFGKNCIGNQRCIAFDNVLILYCCSITSSFEMINSPIDLSQLHFTFFTNSGDIIQ